MFVVMLGPPGSGKGTQSACLASTLGASHLSVGDALRAAAADGSARGERLRDDIASGRLVRDDVVVRVATEHLRSIRGAAVLLDGFPRTIVQAEALEMAFPGAVLVAILLAVPTSTLVRRLSIRSRRDDHRSAIRQRLVSFAQQTRPLVAWYAERGLLAVVDGNRPVAAVTASVEGKLAAIGLATGFSVALMCPSAPAKRGPLALSPLRDFSHSGVASVIRRTERPGGEEV